MDARHVAHIILILNFGHFVGSYSRHVQACRSTLKFVWRMLDVYFQNTKNGVKHLTYFRACFGLA